MFDRPQDTYDDLPQGVQLCIVQPLARPLPKDEIALYTEGYTPSIELGWVRFYAVNRPLFYRDMGSMLHKDLIGSLKDNGIDLRQIQGSWWEWAPQGCHLEYIGPHWVERSLRATPPSNLDYTGERVPIPALHGLITVPVVRATPSIDVRVRLRYALGEEPMDVLTTMQKIGYSKSGPTRLGYI